MTVPARVALCGLALCLLASGVAGTRTLAQAPQAPATFPEDAAAAAIAPIYSQLTAEWDVEDTLTEQERTTLLQYGELASALTLGAADNMGEINALAGAQNCTITCNGQPPFAYGGFCIGYYAVDCTETHGGIKKNTKVLCEGSATAKGDDNSFYSTCEGWTNVTMTIDLTEITACPVSEVHIDSFCSGSYMVVGNKDITGGHTEMGVTCKGASLVSKNVIMKEEEITNALESKKATAPSLFGKTILSRVPALVGRALQQVASEISVPEDVSTSEIMSDMALPTNLDKVPPGCKLLCNGEKWQHPKVLPCKGKAELDCAWEGEHGKGCAQFMCRGVSTGGHCHGGFVGITGIEFEHPEMAQVAPVVVPENFMIDKIMSHTCTGDMKVKMHKGEESNALSSVVACMPGLSSYAVLTTWAPQEQDKVTTLAEFVAKTLPSVEN